MSSADDKDFHGKDERVQNLRQLAKWRATARVLTEALPFILEYDQKTLVVKYGGNAMVSDTLQTATLKPPASSGFVTTGKHGVHSEHLGFVLAEMQSLARAHPAAVW